jgi:hypothetical protein
MVNIEFMWLGTCTKNKIGLSFIMTKNKPQLQDKFIDTFCFYSFRYSDLSTPPSSLNSPESTCLPTSPYSPYDFKLDSPPPTTEEFTEYFNAPATLALKIQRERQSIHLTLQLKEVENLPDNVNNE